MVSLHTLTPDDWPLWREARIAALTDAPHAFKARLADWHRGGRQQWRARLAIPGSLNVVALRKGLPVGMVRGVPGDGGTSELRSLWVSPAARGDGVADQLIGAVTTWALRSGSTTLKLAVVPGNEPATALYRRHGFVTAEEPGDLLPDGVTRQQVMTRRLR
ncbi:GNAT family N-acetyltransferase [Streptomyces sudanensis]|uniref:GNAT family N-acetyltransferase n=1 Tax=Streptomyces sudanensis TaxID=436397 RepID=UPI0020CD3689|nr:GNAT family N-acetyltransferase [Streptomyces sudanensis]MCP9956100.1 GNAT family N-acetyltransferase [Streptomyces sudanensis]MCP9985329.1 GNAT family N-acetyltransferase [Streptomyces sudanensis]MCP9989205.1 GNAT family N-acetyltransferase [Streptomyces sudanensis]MCQ0003295.1 GNAT family N-acetyltransferase [Streptomyces sudanensis]